MRFLLTLIAALVGSLALGLGSAWYMVATPSAGTVEIGRWRALPTPDAATADPYVRARIAHDGDIALGAGEGLTFIVDVDGSGRSLHGDCDYRLVGTTLPARLWTLTASTRKGRFGVTPEGRAAVDSRTLVRDASGRFEVVMSSRARPGNWLPLPAGAAFTLMLRLYDTPLALGSDTPPELPAIERGVCR